MDSLRTRQVAGVFVVDADSVRRAETVDLLVALPDVSVVGEDAGTDRAVADIVRALPHVCVVAASVHAGSTSRFIETVRRALPATEVVRGPAGAAAGRLWQSDLQRQRWRLAMVDLVSTVLVAVGASTEQADAAVCARLEAMTRRRRAVSVDESGTFQL